MRLPLVLALFLVFAPRLAAQEALRGRVVDARGGAPVASARVIVDGGQIPGTEADAEGRFTLVLRPGQHVLRVDRLGYAPLEVGVTGMGGAELVVQLVPIAEALPPLEVTGRRLTLRMQSFETRRMQGQGTGRFFTREELRRYDHASLADLLRRIPGAQIVGSRTSTGSYLASARQLAPYALARIAGPCYSQVYVDGVQIFDGITRPTLPPPNLDEFPVEGLEAVEYYGITSGTPPEFRTLTSGCGTLLLWTRDAR